MIAYIKGQVTEVSINTVVVEAMGVGYELNVSTFCAGGCSVGQDVKLPAYLQASDAGVTLFGFRDRAEKDMFLRLLAVGGVGAKTAIGILSGLSTNDLIAAIAHADAAVIARVKGIGKKTAERIVLELRDKIAKEIEDLPTGSVAVQSVAVDEEAVLALLSLGFNKNEAVAAVAKVQGEGLTTEQVVFKALKG